MPTQLAPLPEHWRSAIDTRQEQLRAVWEKQQPKVAADVKKDLLSFMAANCPTSGGGPPSLFDVTPETVLAYLMSKDGRGLTVVHALECRNLGKGTLAADCTVGCAKRASAASISAKFGTLKGLFRDQVSDLTWTATGGNPCKSPLVAGFVKRTELEQLGAQVSTVQAPLITVAEFRKIWDSVSLASRSAKATGEVAEASKSALTGLLLTLMWHSGLRCNDALRILSQSVYWSASQDSSGRCGIERASYLIVEVGVTKTGRKSNQARTLTFPRDGEKYSLPNTWELTVATLTGCGFRMEPGKLFRSPKLSGAMRDRKWGATFSWDSVAATINHHCILTGLSTEITPQSFHGSHAKFEYERGVPMETTLHKMQWSQRSYKYYLHGRVKEPRSAERQETGMAPPEVRGPEDSEESE
jgi:Protein of unknown function (DUF640)